MSTFTVTRETLLSLVSRVKSVAKNKASLPILDCILLVSNGKELTATATNLEMELQARVAVDLGVWAFCVNAARIAALLQALPEQAQLKLSIEAEKLSIRSGRSRFSVAIMPGVDLFPAFDRCDAFARVTMDASMFRVALASVSYAAGKNDVRYYLNAVCLTFEGPRLRAAASDGHRVSLADCRVEGSGAIHDDLIVPRAAVQELLHCLQDKPEQMLIEYSARSARFTLGGLTLATKLIEAKYPDVNRVIPANPTLSSVIVVADLVAVCRRVLVVAQSDFPIIRLIFTPEGVALAAKNNLKDSAEDEVAAIGTGNAIEIALNGDYLLDALNVMSPDKVQLQVSDQGVLGSAPDDDSYRFVIMPVRL